MPRLVVDRRIILSHVLASAIATFLSIVIAMVVGAVFPFRIGPELAEPVAPGTVYTEKEMKQAETTAKAGMAETRRMFRERPLDVLAEAKRGAVWVTWLPWFLLPFTIKLPSMLRYALLLTLPTVLVLTPFVLPIELLVFGVALGIGCVLARLVAKVTKRASIK